MVVAVIGIGLIGGSMVLSLKSKELISRVIGVDVNPQNAEKALELGIVDEIQEQQKAIQMADVIILSVPVNYSAQLLPEILDQMQEHQVVFDVGSTKGNICSAVANHALRSCYVATHPMAGTENSGPEAAFDGLFTNKITVICDQEVSNKKALETVKKFYEGLEMSIIYMNPYEHDEHIAYVSHISHISSFTLGKAVLDIEKDEKSIFNMASTGFASTVRLAKSSPAMWTPIFMQNDTNIIKALDVYIEQLVSFKSMIEKGDQEGLRDYMKKANDIRRILEGIELKNK